MESHSGANGPAGIGLDLAKDACKFAAASVESPSARIHSLRFKSACNMFEFLSVDLGRHLVEHGAVEFHAQPGLRRSVHVPVLGDAELVFHVRPVARPLGRVADGAVANTQRWL